MNTLCHLTKGKKKVDESDTTNSLFQVIVSFIFHLLFFHYYLLYFTHMFCLHGTSLRGHQREALMEVLIAPEQAAPEQVPGTIGDARHTPIRSPFRMLFGGSSG
jgi:hypothetical protein